MEAHYRRLVWAVLAVALAAVGWVGWGSLRGAPESTVIAAAPRTLELPAGSAATGDPALPVAGPQTAPMPAAAPDVSASIEAPAAAKPTLAPPGELRVHVVGSVRRAGVLALPAGSRVIDALKAAGGARPDADLEAINLADFVRDGEQIQIPSRRMTRAAVPRGAPPAAIRRAPADPAQLRAPSASTRTLGRYPPQAAPAPGSPAASPTAADSVVNVNTAGLEELDTLPGVGAVTAQAILDYRRDHGPFQRPEDLLNVRGIGDKKLAAMLARVRVR
jgi:competence protein ComEA